jgi:signal peptidase I
MSEEVDGLRAEPEPAPNLAAPAVSPAATPVTASSTERKARNRNVAEWIGIVAGALILALIVKTFLFQAFYIPSLSMYPTLDKGDRVLVNKLSYDLHDVHRGDVVVFGRPPSEPTSIKDLIKRVIGLPGDVIEARDGVVYINGKALVENYVDSGDRTENLPRQTVPPGKLFVMGDNRNNSEDSRVFGPIPVKSVVGRAFVRVWPLTRIGLL